MPTTPANGLTLAWDRFGDRGPTVFLIMGIGAQRIFWPAPLCEALAARGLQVIRFDNRDVGESTRLDHLGVPRVGPLTAKALLGVRISAPYTLDDMAEDTLALATALGAPRAHFVGASMGGMIAQHLALRHPTAVRSLTSIMSTTGDPDVGQPTPEAVAVLLEPAPSEREAYLAQSIVTGRLLSGPEHCDEDWILERNARAFDRCFHPDGVTAQLIAIVTSPSRSEGLRGLDLPALVVHGDIDPLVTISGGERTAECLAGCEFLRLEGMGHDIPRHYWSTIIEHVTAMAARAA